MAESRKDSKEVDQFILEHIDSVPHLEALLLLWVARPKVWSPTEVSTRLYIAKELAEGVMRDLVRERLIQSVSESQDAYRYDSTSDQRDALLQAVDAAYRSEMVRISTMIHSKASAAVREFARAFRFTKEGQ